MKKYLLLSLAALSLAATASAEPSFKRGLAEGNFSTRAEMDQLVDGVSWYYNWSTRPNSGANNEVADNDTWEFCPMTWNGNFSEDAIREYVRSHPKTKYILGFNEPNFIDQAHMTPQEAAEIWPRVKAVADELGLQVVSPAVNNSSWSEWSDPVKWMREFIRLAGIDNVDYIAFHAYGGMGNITDTATRLWNEFHKPLWLTEFCNWPGGAGATYVAPEAQMAAMVEMVKWCEKTEYLYRYSWFQAFEKSHNFTNPSSSHVCPNYFLYEPEYYKDENNKTKVRWAINDRGKVYKWLGTYDKNVWHTADGSFVNAGDCIDHSSVSMVPSTCTLSTRPIDINSFQNGSYVDYQFNVPSAGEYTLTLVASGFGEPTRFDAKIAVYTVDANGNESNVSAQQTLALPNNDARYNSYYFPCTLAAGNQTIRVKCEFRPNGMRLAGVKLGLTAGIDNVSADRDDLNTPCDIFDLQGRRVMSNVIVDDMKSQLPAGIYVANGRKIAVR